MRKPCCHQAREHHVVADPADRHHIEPLDADPPQRRHPPPKLVGGDLARGRHPVGHQQHPRTANFVGHLQRAERSFEIGSAERAASDDPLADDADRRAGLAGKQGNHILVESGDGDGRIAVLAQLHQQPLHRGGLVAEAEGSRRAGVDQELQVVELLARCGLGERDDARDDQVFVAQPESAARDLMRQLEVGVGREVAPLEPRVCFAVEYVDRQRPEARQAAQGQPVRLTCARQLLCIGDDDLFGRRRRNGEHPCRKLIARLRLQQRRVLLVMQEVLVSDARRLLLDDLSFLPAITNPHREAADRRPGRQRDPEAPLPHPVLRIAEGQVQLGESQRIVDGRVGRQGHQLEAGAVRGGQADGRRRRDDDAPRAGLVAGEQGTETQEADDDDANRCSQGRGAA